MAAGEQGFIDAAREGYGDGENSVAGSTAPVPSYSSDDVVAAMQAGYGGGKEVEDTGEDPGNTHDGFGPDSPEPAGVGRSTGPWDRKNADTDSD